MMGRLTNWLASRGNDAERAPDPGREDRETRKVLRVLPGDVRREALGDLGVRRVRDVRPGRAGGRSR